MVTVFALAAALLYGSADFLGGVATRRAHVLSVLLVSAPRGWRSRLGAALLAGGPPQAAGIAWGACAGAAGGVGFMFFYAGLAAGPMSVVAPLSALVSTVLPVAAALAEGERPGLRVYAGALVCVAAIVLVSSGGDAGVRPEPPGTSAAGPANGGHAGAGPGRSRRTGRRRAPDGGPRYRLRVASGVAFGMFFLFIRNGGESGALWPVAVARAAGTLVVAGGRGRDPDRPGALAAGRPAVPRRRSARACSTPARTSATCSPPGRACSASRWC